MTRKPVFHLYTFIVALVVLCGFFLFDAHREHPIVQPVRSMTYNDISTISGTLSGPPTSSPTPSPEPYITVPTIIAETKEYKHITPTIAPPPSFSWPVKGSISQYPSSYHIALDITSDGRQYIRASEGGSVVHASCEAYDYGCYIVIQHPAEFKTLYAHLSSMYVSQGARVNRGEIIGLMGATGRATGVHLHFEILKDNLQLNPLMYLDG